MMPLAAKIAIGMWLLLGTIMPFLVLREKEQVTLNDVGMIDPVPYNWTCTVFGLSLR
jgi:hypothetical protein